MKKKVIDVTAGIRQIFYLFIIKSYTEYNKATAKKQTNYHTVAK